MKVLKLSFLMLMLSVSTITFASSGDQFLELENWVKRLITWNSSSVDVGEIPKGVPYTVTFEFKNTYDEPVIITQVKASCGCTATEYSKNAIEPGKSGFVNAVYNAASEGTFSKTVTVTTSASDTPQKLTFKGTVVNY